MNLRDNLIYFVILLVIIFIIHLVINLWRLKKGKNILGDDYVVSKFRLDHKKIGKKKLVYSVSFINSFIISLVGIVIFLIPLDLIWQMLIGSVLLFGLIYAIYEIYGRYLISKGYGKKKVK